MTIEMSFIMLLHGEKPIKASWEIGINQILNHVTIDYYTRTKDFSSDILARAQFFAKNGY